MAESDAKTYKVRFREFSDLRLNMSYVKAIKAKPGQKKYVYVFKKHSWGVSVTAEICYDERGDWKMVDWSPGAGTRWASSANPDNRPATISKEFIEITIDPSTEVYVFLSQVQLTYRRIMEYQTASHDFGAEGLLNGRALRFDPAGNNWTTSEYLWTPPGDGVIYLWVPPVNAGPVATKSAGPGTSTSQKRKKKNRDFVKLPPFIHTVFLIDYLDIAKAIQAEYLRALDARNRFLLEEVEAERRFLATLTWSVAEAYAKENKSAWDWINVDGPSGLKTYLDGQHTKMKQLEDDLEAWAKSKCHWLNGLGYTEMRSDYVHMEEFILEHEADLFECTIQSQEGRAFLEAMVRDSKSWYNQYFLSGNFFQVTRRTTQSFERFVTYLSEGAIAQIKAGQQEAQVIEKGVVDTIIRAGPAPQMISMEAKFAEHLVSFPGVKGVSYAVKTEYGLNATMKQLRQMQLQVLDLEKYEQTLKGLGLFTDKIMFCLQAVNMAIVLDALNLKGPTLKITKDSLALMSALADMIRAWIKVFKQSLAQGTLFRALGMFASVCNYFRSVLEIGEASWKGKWGLVAAWTATALGATASGVGFTLGAEGALWGVSSLAWTIWGAVLLGIGALLVWLFYETPLEEWLKACTWGKNPSGKGATAQLKDLIELVADPKVSVEIIGTTALQGFFMAPQKIRFVVAPALFVKDVSWLSVDLILTSHSKRFSGPGSLDFLSEKQMVLPESQRDTVLLRREDSVDRIIREWDWNAVYDSAKMRTLPPGDTSFISFKATVRVNVAGIAAEQSPSYSKKGVVSYPQLSGN